MFLELRLQGKALTTFGLRCRNWIAIGKRASIGKLTNCTASDSSSRADLSLPIWSVDETDYFRVGDNTATDGRARSRAPIPNPLTCVLVTRTYLEVHPG